jgi:CheY-like chemotaxis protein
MPTVLVVEDTDDTRTVLRVTLEGYGYVVLEARNGREAVEAVGEACPDLILMDLHMPEMDGMTATERIRELKGACESVPIVAITAYDIYGMKEAAIESGCNDYIPKPINFDRLETCHGFEAGGNMQLVWVISSPHFVDLYRLFYKPGYEPTADEQERLMRKYGFRRKPTN